jgi:dihydroflavonol-4-reductase
MATHETVLVTGGSGFIASWCIARLLNDGFNVKATVRSLSRADDTRRVISSAVPAALNEALTFRAADLESDAGWDEAAAGCRYVLHVASPLGMDSPRDPEILIRPARDGALRVLRAAIKHGVERVVMTSSVAAIAGERPAGLHDETRWTDLKAKGVLAYPQSKTIAERAAWELIKTSGKGTTLTAINPVIVLGPVLSPDFSGSVTVISRLLSGKAPGIPNFGLNFVDVRDVADLHVRAMLAPNAAGERFIANAGFLWLSEVADLLRENLGPAARKVPRRRLPDWLVRLVALRDSSISLMIPVLSRRVEYDATKAKTQLAWTPRSAKDAILAAAESLIRLKIVRPRCTKRREQL